VGAVVSGLLAGSLVLTACGSAGTAGSAGNSNSSNATVGVSLILKTLTNSYFVSMENDAKQEAAKDGVKLTVSAGTQDGDTQTQISAIDNAISRGDKGIIITPNGNAVNTELAKARQAGLYLIALDTVPTPPSAVDITYATDNLQAGKLIGQYAADRLNGADAVIAMLDDYNNQVVSVDVDRDHSFLEGIGINPGNPDQNGQEPKTGHYTGGKGGNYQVVCHQPTQGSVTGGKTAMENCLSSNGGINVVYTINEPAADGAHQALQAAGKNNVVLVTIDGSCNYINGLVANGTFAADAAQYPGKMAVEGVQTIASVARGGAKPTMPAGQNFLDSGTTLVTADPVPDLPSQTPAQAAATCWGS